MQLKWQSCMMGGFCGAGVVVGLMSRQVCSVNNPMSIITPPSSTTIMSDTPPHSHKWCKFKWKCHVNLHQNKQYSSQIGGFNTLVKMAVSKTCITNFMISKICITKFKKLKITKRKIEYFYNSPGRWLGKSGRIYHKKKMATRKSIVSYPSDGRVSEPSLMLRARIFPKLLFIHHVWRDGGWKPTMAYLHSDNLSIQDSSLKLNPFYTRLL